VAPTQIGAFPDIVGVGLTVTITVFEHPLSSKYVIVDVPDPTPVTRPVLSTVATNGSEDVQGVAPSGVPDAVN